MPKGTCSVEGCGLPERSLGLCNRHYQRSYLYGRLNKRNEPEQAIADIHKRDEADGRRSHPLYSIWWGRKNAGVLVAAWTDSFWRFVEDVGGKPGPHYYFAVLDEKKLLGPGNFEWREKLRKRPGETKKEFWSRKWQSRRKHYPAYEASRALKRKYGITLAEYEKMRDEQGGVCAICHQPETAFDAKTLITRGLAVDHCHKTKRVRGLLCFRCNSVIGKVEESLELLDACRDYLIKHQPTEQSK